MRKTRLIDANKLRKDILGLADCYNGFSDTYDKAQIIDMIDEQPTVDPVKHGRWTWDYNEAAYFCSICNHDGSGRFCPHCGAKMDGDENG